MKTHMVNHVENQHHNIFLHSTKSVKTQLQALCKRVEHDMRAHVLNIYNLIARDYLAVLVGVESNVQVPGVPNPELLLRAEMLPILRDAGRQFIISSDGDDDPSQDRDDDPFQNDPFDHDDDPFKDESVFGGQSPRTGDDDDFDGLAATQLQEESEASACGRDGVKVKSELAV